MMNNIFKHPPYSLRTLAIVGVIIMLVVYSLFAARGIIQNPRISIESPQNGTTIYSPLVTISGNTNTISYLRINGRSIPIHENNTFSNAIVLKEGYNVITLEAGDRFGRTTQRELHLMHTRRFSS